MIRGARAALACAVLMLVACADEPADSAPTKAATPDKVQRMSGPELYQSHCALCHGDEGQGYVADNATALDNPNFLESASDEFLRSAIEHGRPGTSMSAWGSAVGGPFDDRDLDALVDTLRDFASVHPIAVDDIMVMGSAVRAQSYYDVKCKMCHGELGQGGEFVSIANPEFLAAASDGYLRHAILHGRPGTPMPAFSGMLADQIIDDLVVLIRSWQLDPVKLEAESPKWPDDPILHPDGPEPDFGEAQLVGVDAVHAALDRGERLLIADARAPTDYVVDHITGAVSVPFYDAEKYLDRLPKDVTIVGYCGCPHAASGALAERLGKQGYARVKVLDEGYFVWQKRGYPLTAGTSPE